MVSHFPTIYGRVDETKYTGKLCTRLWGYHDGYVWMIKWVCVVIADQIEKKKKQKNDATAKNKTKTNYDMSKNWQRENSSLLGHSVLKKTLRTDGVHLLYARENF